MKKTVIWGTLCQCGCECFLLQSKHHPWSKTDYIAEIICPECQKVHRIDQKQAARFYNQKIYDLFTPINGNVLDFGCGAGFMTWFASQQPEVEKILAMDIDAGVIDKITQIDPGIEFISGSEAQLITGLAELTVDELISRDVIMFIDDIDGFIRSATQAAKNRVRILGWYKPEDKRVNNILEPESIKCLFNKYNWQVDIEYLDWYAYGYFIDARPLA